MTRQSRELSSTGIYHIMLRGNERKKVFQDNEDKLRFLEAIETKQKDTNFSIYAYCLMDNHVHLLIKTNNNDLASIMKGIAVSYASYFNWKQNRVGHVFQDRFKSESIEEDRYLLAVVRYIHNNPVKAGIVEKPSEYAWSSYCDYLRLEEGSWLDTQFILSLFGDEPISAIKNFERFSMDGDDLSFLECENEKEIRTLEEGKIYIEEYMKRMAVNLDYDQIKKDKQLRKEIVLHLRNNTDLSQRVIADLLGIKKGVVERIIDKNKSL